MGLYNNTTREDHVLVSRQGQEGFLVGKTIREKSNGNENDKAQHLQNDERKLKR